MLGGVAVLAGANLSPSLPLLPGRTSRSRWPMRVGWQGGRPGGGVVRFVRADIPLGSDGVQTAPSL